jgi:hypothetical protein
MNFRKITYSKMTFVLSVIGFIGSLGFYLGVLRQVYSKPSNIEIEMVEIKRENELLKSQVEVLTTMVEESKDNE